MIDFVAVQEAMSASSCTRIERVQSIVARLPQHDFGIRRRFAHDPYFRAICADYEEASAALRHWQASTDTEDPRVKEYAGFLAELEAEILAQLGRPG